MLLADGRVAFTGSPQHALSFFANHGYYCPEAYNPADFLIGVLATDPGYEQASQRSAQHLCDQFAVSSAAKQRDMLVNLEIHMAQSGNFPFDTEVDSFRGVSWLKRFYVVWLRTTLTLLRDPTIQWMRFVQKMAMAFIIGVCFAGTTELSQLGVQAVQVGRGGQWEGVAATNLHFLGHAVHHDIGEHLSSHVLRAQRIPAGFSALHA